MIRNVHERVIGAPSSAVGEVLETLGTPLDALWRTRIARPVVLDDGLRPGSRGGHGPIRYHVVEHEPGRRVVFAFDPPTGLVGTHSFETVPRPDGSTLVRHALVGRPTRAMRVLWPLLVRTLHDGVVEDVLDHLEHRLTGTAHRRQKLSVRARLVARTARRPALRVPVREDGLLADALPRVHAADAWAVELMPGDATDLSTWHHALMGEGPGWVRGLMAVRDAAVRPLGLRTGAGTVTPFPEIARTEDEVLLGLDDRHLSFRVSLRVQERTVSLTTLVQRHGRLGDAYWAVVRWFHPLVVRAQLRRVPGPSANGVRTPSGRTA